MPESGPSINLAQNKQLPFIDKFMNWALTVGRLIVIVTEIVAAAAFVYRFSLDEKLADLHTAIKQKQVIISLLKQDENKYRNLQGRIALASNTSEKISKTNKIIKDVINLVPQAAKISDFTLNKDKLSININITSISTLADFVDALKNYPHIKSINIDNIENNPSSGLLVDITTALK